MTMAKGPMRCRRSTLETEEAGRRRQRGGERGSGYIRKYEVWGCRDEERRDRASPVGSTCNISFSFPRPVPSPPELEVVVQFLFFVSGEEEENMYKETGAHE